jgi:hypothetical protein
MSKAFGALEQALEVRQINIETIITSGLIQ